MLSNGGEGAYFREVTMWELSTVGAKNTEKRRARERTVRDTYECSHAVHSTRGASCNSMLLVPQANRRCRPD